MTTMNLLASGWTAKYVPVMSGLFTTGQWYFEGEKSDMAGNLALTFVPAVQFSNSLSLIPTIQSNYRGTRSAEELAGGNTFFHDTWENGAGVKLVHGLNSRWNLRENAGYRFKLFRETVEENWSEGLYDYNVANAGVEIERHWNKKANIALGYDFSYLQFPNYESLESSQAPDLSREFAGEKPLNSRIHMMSLRTRVPLMWKMSTNLQAFASNRDYTGQYIVALSGLYTPEQRKDEYAGGNLSLDRIFSVARTAKLISSVQFGHATMNSNQNHYDARQTHFAADYYDYDQNSIGADFTLAFGNAGGNPMLIDAGYNYVHRDYRSRTIQAEGGAYGVEKLYQIDQSFSLGFSYPLSRNFRVRTSSTFGQSKSNNNYEEVYRYNYKNAEYQFGFTYDY